MNKQHSKAMIRGKNNFVYPNLSVQDIDEVWRKASAENNKINDKMILFCSRPVLVEDKYKVVLFPVLMDKKGEVYWCYKSEIFGFHNRCVAHVIGKAYKDFNSELFLSYDEVFKRGLGDSIEVPSKMKTASQDPEKVGNKVLFYVHTLHDNSGDEFDSLIDKFVESLKAVQQHPEYCKICLEKTFANYGGKYSDHMKTAMINDKTFSRIMSCGTIHVERNVSLYDVTTSAGVRYILNQIFSESKPPVTMWGYSLKSFCFKNGIVPKGFLYPN